MGASPTAMTGLFAGRYAIERLIGEGATATVHLARDTQRGVAVAVKLLREELAESAHARRFVKEIRRTEALDHPSILPVLDAGEFEGRPYFVLPYMEGGTLRQRLRREPQLDLRQAAEILRPIAAALDYASERGLIHRDVKPENILFSEGLAYLGDFGIARALRTAYGDSTTSANVIRGTPAYMSPEQAAGSDKLDGRSDLFSLACVYYEMVTGMPAYQGPTAESTLQMRFKHPPREVAVYRPSAPAGIQRVLNGAFAVQPADRPSTATALIDALIDALVDARATEPVPPRLATPRRLWWLAAAGSLALAGAAWLTARPGRTPTMPLDTTRVVILPFDGSAAPFSAEELIYQGLQRWQGLKIVETFAARDAIVRHGSLSSLGDAYAIAAQLGAGRFVRGRVTQAGADHLVYATLYDVGERRELHHSTVLVPDDTRQAMSAYATLADSLLLRGTRAEAPELPTGGSTTLPAVQSMLRARAALADWDLAAADSLFESAVDFDPAYARAHLWLAQVRSWEALNRNRWVNNIVSAMRDTVALNSAEREQGAALQALATQDYPTACAQYQRMLKERPTDFLAWYGLGECQRLDAMVLRDTRSPSGWRFRSNYYRGMLAYRRAFELFPTSYRQFQGNAYEALRRWLFTGAQLRPGVASDSSLRFYARAGASGDTIVFVPYPQDVMLGGSLDGPAISRAQEMTRRMFRDVAFAWAAAVPRNPATKEAVAVALEMVGDMTAARDSFRAARTLATEPAPRLRLAVAEILVDTKAAVAGPRRDFTRSIGLADSLFTAAAPVDRESAVLLARIAVLTGRCAMAKSLLARSTPGIPGPMTVPPTLVAEVYSIQPAIVLGCDAPTHMPRLAATLSSIGGSEKDRIEMEYRILASVVAMFPEEYVDIVRRLAKPTGDYVLVAEDSLSRGDTAATRRLLLRQLDRRQRAGIGGPPLDAGLTEAKLFLMLADTTTAIALLDRALAEFGRSQPVFSADVFNNPVAMASVGATLLLRSRVAIARHQAPEPWASLLAQLWSGADPPLQPAVQRLRQFATR